MEYAESVASVASTHLDLAHLVRDWTSLEDIMRWMHAHSLKLSTVERVPMDEYSHDVIVPLPAQACWLVFGCT